MNVVHQFLILIDDYPFAAQLKSEILPLLKNYPDQQGRKTNVQALMTEWHWQDDNVQVHKLKKYIINEIRTKLPTKSIGHRDLDYYFQEFWANVYERGDSANVHNHWPKATFGFVYFLKSKWYYSSLVFGDKKKVFPKEGRFVIFPSYLNHHVSKHRYREQRITLSGNIKFVDGF